MKAAATLDHRELYRLPWTLPDNAISWLEPTSACNLACDGCYRENVKDSHKPLTQVREELAAFRRLRNSDGISIAGGDPLMHPDIVEIVREVRALGMKPILNTNGARLSKELLRELKQAGAYGFTFHVDSKQGRPGWRGKNEIELNEPAPGTGGNAARGGRAHVLLQLHRLRGHAADCPGPDRVGGQAHRSRARDGLHPLPGRGAADSVRLVCRVAESRHGRPRVQRSRRPAGRP